MSKWSKKCEDIVNSQINLEYWASYQYHLIWSYFDRDSVGLKNIAEYYKKASIEEREHAHKLMEYQNMRGGTVKLTTIGDVDLNFLNQPDCKKMLDVLSSFIKALNMEQIVYESLLQVHAVGDECNDPQFCDFIESEYLEEQVTAINEIKKYIEQLKRIGDDGAGVWQFDRLFENSE